MRSLKRLLPLKSLCLSLVMFGGVLGAATFFTVGNVSADCGFTGTVHDYAGFHVVSKVQKYGGGAPIASSGSEVKISEYGWTDPNTGVFTPGGRSDAVGGNIVQLSPAGGYPSGLVTNRVTSATFSQIGGCAIWPGSSPGSQVVLPGNGTNGSPSTSNGGSNWGLDCDNSQIGDDSLGRHYYQQFSITGIGTPTGAVAGGTWSVYHTAPNDFTPGVVSAANGTANTAVIVYTEPGPTWQLEPGDSIPPSSVSSVSTGVPFGHQIWDVGPNRANFNWYLQQSYNGGFTNSNIASLPGPVNGTVTNGPVNSPPDVDLNYTYHFPSGAKAGDKYCQRTAFSNPNGPGTSSGSTPNSTWGFGSNTCVTYNPGGTGNPCTATGTCPANVACTEDLHTLTPHANYRFTLYDNAGSYVSATPVPVTGPNGAGDYNSTSTYSSMGAWASLVGGAVQQATPTNGSPSPLAYTFNYPPPQGPDAYSVVEAWIHNPSTGNWTYSYKVEGVSNCYSATCTISVAGNVPGGGSGDVQAGSTYSATATITNTGIQPIQGIDWAGNADTNGNPAQPLSIPGGTPATPVDMNPPPAAPGAIGSYVVGGGVYYGPYQVAGCSPAPVNTFQHFTLVPTASIDPATSPEDPTSIIYDTAVTQGPDPYAPNQYAGTVASNTHSILNYQPYGGASTTVDNVPNSGNYGNASYTNTYTNTNPIQAGDQFCPVMVIDNATGWIGPSGEIDGAPATSSSGCLTVSNRPFFKVYNGSASAGGAYQSLSPNCSGGGVLASWNNNSGTYPASGDFGASAQIGALALGPITGFASNQSAFGNDPTGLSFANSVSVDKTQDPYNPKLGGNFNTSPGAGDCFTDVSPPAGGGGPIAGPKTIGTVGSPTYLNPGQNQSVFVTGDVYISSNVQYVGDNTKTGSLAAWNSTGNVPSYVVHATGNIFIDPSVTELDGLYEAQGKIYTCGANTSPYSAMALSLLYTGCNNQLTVYGNLIATQINMARSFGSLRDETPNPSTSSGGTPGATAPLNWSFAGTISGNSCTRVYEPSEPNEPNYSGPPHGSNGWIDNYLCVPPGDGSPSPVQVSFTCDNWAAGNPNGCDSGSPLPNCVNIGSFINAGPWNYPFSYAWGDNQLCSNYGISLTTSPSIPGNYCTKMLEPADHDGNNIWQQLRVCIPQGTAGSFSAATANVATPCSNQGAVTSPQTCAAEIIYSTPELYLSSPNIGQPSYGAPQWDSVTSLPPLL